MANRDSVYTDNIDLSVKSIHEERDANASPPAGSVHAGHDPNRALLENKPEGFGKPSSKPILDPKDLLVLVVAIVCCVLACAVVTFDQIAWHLHYKYQLVLVGFFLSSMVNGLKSMAPTLLQICEVRFGTSKLQNMDALRTNSVIASQVDWWWRSAIGLLIALPLGLSASYKLFQGGVATIRVASHNSIYDVTFGINAPPGMLPLGWNTGLMLMTNATMPFLTASTNQSADNDAALNDVRNDYPVPTQIQAYGFNTLLLDNQTAALLDSPSPVWIDGVRNLIGDGDAVEVEADVLGTVSVSDDTIDRHRSDTDPWWNRNLPSDQTRMLEGTVDLNAGAFFWLRTKLPTSFDFDQASPCFLSLYHDPSSPITTAQMFNTSRRNCHGRWNITKSAVVLINGSCDIGSDTGGLLNSRAQMIFTNFTGLALVEYFPPILAEIIAPFLNKSTSQWQKPTTAVAVASMYWSRVAAAVGPSSPHWLGNDSYASPIQGGWQIVNNASITYTTNPVIFWSRPAMRKSVWLYLIICAPPMLTLAVLIAIVALYRVPIGRGFGLVTVLAGVEQESLGLLRGAGFSGELTQPVHLAIFVREAGNKARGMALRYRLRDTKPRAQDEIRRNTVLS